MNAAIKKVMVVEDDEAIREGIMDFLTLEGYEVSESENGMEALTKLKTDQPDIVISDVMMPVMDGHTLLEEYRRIEGAPQVPFIFLTALSDRNDLRKGMKLGADDYLTKPFSREELLDAIDTQYTKFHQRKENIENEFEAIIRERLDLVEKEKESVIKELHHRVKHNLAIISAFFELGDPAKGPDYINSIKNRVFALASVHEEAYSSEMLTTVDTGDLISNIIDKLMANSGIRTIEEIDHYNLDIAQAIPFGLLFYELLNQILKKPFKRAESPRITIRSFQSGNIGKLILVVNSGEIIDVNNPGEDTDVLLVQTFINQLHGQISCQVVPEIGVRYSIDYQI